MAGKRGGLLFRGALLAALASVCLSAYVIAHAQTGPSWEVPVAIVQELRTLPVVALLLAAVALGVYIWSFQAGRVGGAAQGGFWFVLIIATVLPLAIWWLKPEQWPFQFVTLSFLAMIQIVPTVIVSLIFFWLIGFRWARVG